MKHAVRVVLGLLVSAVFLYFTFRGFDFGHVRQALVGIRLPLVAIAVVTFTFVLGLRAVRWKLVLEPVQDIALSDVVPPVAVGYLANNVLPARGGELIRAAALSRKTNLAFAASAGSLIADRVTDLFGLIVVMIISARLLPWNRIPVLPVATVAVVGLVGLAFGGRALSRIKVGEGGGLRQKLLSFATKLGEGFAAIRSPRRLAVILAISSLVWVLDATTSTILSHATGFPLSFIECTALLVALAAAVSIPAAPGYVGTYEFFGKQVLVLLGHDPATALTFVVLLHFFQMSLMAVLGVPSLFFIGAPEEKAA